MKAGFYDLVFAMICTPVSVRQEVEEGDHSSKTPGDLCKYFHGVTQVIHFVLNH